MEKTGLQNAIGRVNNRKSVSPIIIIGALFFILGFITWVNSTLIPYLKITCEITVSQAVLVTFASYIAYSVMAFPVSYILKITGFKNGISLSLIIMAIGALVFIPAANSRNFNVFLTGIFITGLGATILQSAVNPYLTFIGPVESAAKRISIMGICNKIAGAIAPLLMGAILLTNLNKYSKIDTLGAAEKNLLLNELSAKIVMPYVFIAAVLVVMALLIKYSHLPAIQFENKDESATGNPLRQKKSLFEYPYLWLGFVTLFLTSGAEVIAADIIQLYGNTGLNIPMEKSRVFTTYTLVAMLAGYLFSIFISPKYIRQEKVLMIASVLGIVFSIGVIFAPGIYSILFLSLLGFSNAQMWPTIWPLSINNLGRLTQMGSALLIVALAGAATIPRLWAYVSEKVGMQQAFGILVPCYLFSLYFSTKGFKVGNKGISDAGKIDAVVLDVK